ncbi:MAG: rod shape-determining protein MreB, partial [Firmicutes bacterium]|nr:rod shape-determining protein MreB [Bacillota bacterium]
VAIRPLLDGVIADYNTTEKMLSYFIQKATGRGWFYWFYKPRVVVCIPSGVTEVEERAVKQAATQSGAKSTVVVEEPYAAALGAGLDIASARGNLVVDIGGGTTDIAVISLGGIVCKKSLRVGGDKFDESIVRFIRREYSVMIGDRTAEQIKIRVGSALEDGKPAGQDTFEVRGRDLVSGLPKTITVSSREAYVAMEEQIEAVVSAVKEVLERTPPELSADILNQGIVMTGGGSLLWGLDTRISRETGLPVNLAEDAVSCVALGTGKILEGGAK